MIFLDDKKIRLEGQTYRRNVSIIKLKIFYNCNLSKLKKLQMDIASFLFNVINSIYFDIILCHQYFIHYNILNL